MLEKSLSLSDYEVGQLGPRHATAESHKMLNKCCFSRGGGHLVSEKPRDGGNQELG